MKGVYKETVITYSESIMKRLQKYIGERKGRVFITRTGKSAMINQVAVTFAKAGKQVGIAFKITPHVLRSAHCHLSETAGISRQRCYAGDWSCLFGDGLRL